SHHLKPPSDCHITSCDAQRKLTHRIRSDIDELQRLGDLHTSGVLTDEEFTAAKAKILGTSGTD
ncbi:MAG: SHOCT domain-containing protein, partial [Solirubrobacteraceae bacterium]